MPLMVRQYPLTLLMLCFDALTTLRFEVSFALILYLDTLEAMDSFETFDFFMLHFDAMLLHRGHGTDFVLVCISFFSVHKIHFS